MVAPVRETAAQALATLMPFMAPQTVAAVHRILVAMVRQGGGPLDSTSKVNLEDKGKGVARKYVWQVRHAGLLGLKYLVAVRGDVLRAPLRGVDSFSDKVKLEDGIEAGDARGLLREVVAAALLG